MLEGIDVSSWQGAIDWSEVADAGKTFAWIRASTGFARDERFAANWAGALYLGGMQRGAYHVLSARSSAEEQAAAFLRVYPGAGELPPALDLERWPDGAAPSAVEALRWLDIVTREIGSRPMVYCSPAFAEERLFADHPALGLLDLWVAHHGVTAPRVPAPWTGWRAWQTGAGRVDGITGPVDIDVMRAW